MEVIMFIKYSFGGLSRCEEEQWSNILVDEMESQFWFVVACSALLQKESLVTTQ
jgi:hypothetical protein